MIFLLQNRKRLGKRPHVLAEQDVSNGL